jgi:hypothetical protein
MQRGIRRSLATRALIAIPVLAALAASLVIVAGPSSAAPDHHGRGVSVTRGTHLAAPGKPRASWPDCPATTEYCYINLHFDTHIYCSSFTSAVGACVGSSTGTAAWAVPIVSLPGLWSQFQWLPAGGNFKEVQYTAVNLAVPVAILNGKVPGPGSADFYVERAYALKSPHPTLEFFTPNMRGVPAGQVGGPLHLNFEGGVIGADVYIHGYLRHAGRLRQRS